MINCKLKEIHLASLAILFSSFMWGLVWYPSRILEQAGMPVVWTTLVVYFAAALFSLSQLRSAVLIFKHSSGWMLIALALAAGITNITFLLALTRGEVMRVMLLFYLSPLWTVLLGHWWLAEHISRHALLLIMLAMSGTVMMLWQPEMGLPWPHGIGDWLALVASIMFSVNNVLSRKMAQVPIHLKTTVVYWGVVLVAVAALLLQQAPIPEVAVNIWLSVAVIGGLCFSAMTLAVLYGLARMPVFRSAVLMLFELIVAALSAWWLTDERMSSVEWLGGILILLAGFLLVRQQR